MTALQDAYMQHDSAEGLVKWSTLVLLLLSCERPAAVHDSTYCA